MASQLSKGSSAQFASLVHDVKDLLSLCKLVLHMGDRLAILQLGLGSVPHGHGHNPRVGAFKLLLQPPNQLGLASASRGIQEAAHVGNDLVDKEVLRILVASVCFHEMTPFQASQVQIKAALLVATPPDWQGVSTLILQLEHRIPTPRVSLLLYGSLQDLAFKGGVVEKQAVDVDSKRFSTRDGLHKLHGPVRKALLHLQGDVSVGTHGVEVHDVGAAFEGPDSVAKVLATSHVARAVVHIHAPDLAPFQMFSQLTAADPAEAHELDEILEKVCSDVFFL